MESSTANTTQPFHPLCMKPPDFSNLSFDDITLPTADPKNWAHLQGATPGFSPFLRGPYATMYAQRSWTIRQYAGFSTAEESNAFYKRNLAKGQRGLSIAFDLPTHRGYDSDHAAAQGDVGKAGVAIDTVEDMKRLFEGISLDSMSVSMTMNGAVLPIMAFYIVAAMEQGVDTRLLSGTLQNDILKEFIVRNTYIYPPKASMRIVTDIFSYIAQHLPRFHPISISGYHMHEAGAPADLELAYTLINGLSYVQAGIDAGLAIDDFAPRLSFFWGIGMNFVEEIAKLRAARHLWAKYLQQLGAKDPKSCCLRAHSQTSGWSLTAQDPYNNVARTCFEAMAAVFGHTQSLHTNALDEALALPTDFSARIARNTQLYLMHELQLGRVIDPWGGSRVIEERTQALMERVEKHIQEIESAGGMLSAIEAGLPKQRIEEAATQKQANIEAGKEVLIGVNSWESNEKIALPLLKIDNEQVITAQENNLKRVKEQRDNTRTQAALAALSACAKRRQGNLLALAIQAAQARASLGEISTALEQVFGRYTPQTSTVQGVYGKHIPSAIKDAVQQRCTEFEQKHGRRPRVLLAKIGQDGHDRGYRVVATALADMGFDVDLGPLFQTPEQVAKQAVDNDVHWIGISSLSAGHSTHIPLLMKALKKLERADIQVFVGGIIPEQDYASLRKAGVCMIFGTGTKIGTAALQIIDQYE